MSANGSFTNLPLIEYKGIRNQPGVPIYRTSELGIDCSVLTSKRQVTQKKGLKNNAMAAPRSQTYCQTKFRINPPGNPLRPKWKPKPQSKRLRIGVNVDSCLDKLGLPQLPPETETHLSQQYPRNTRFAIPLTPRRMSRSFQENMSALVMPPTQKDKYSKNKKLKNNLNQMGNSHFQTLPHAASELFTNVPNKAMMETFPTVAEDQPTVRLPPISNLFRIADVENFMITG